VYPIFSSRTHSLSYRYHFRWEVPALIIASTALLVIGLSLPLMSIEKMVLWKNEYSVFTGIVSLFQANQWLLGAILFFFSMVFPFAKLAALLVIWWFPMKNPDRKALLRWLSILGKWSMLDVFAVSILIVLVKLGSLANIEPESGLYFFCAAILGSMLTTVYVEHLAKSASKS